MIVQALCFQQNAENIVKVINTVTQYDIWFSSIVQTAMLYTKILNNLAYVSEDVGIFLHDSLTFCQKEAAFLLRLFLHHVVLWEYRNLAPWLKPVIFYLETPLLCVCCDWASYKNHPSPLNCQPMSLLFGCRFPKRNLPRGEMLQLLFFFPIFSSIMQGITDTIFLCCLWPLLVLAMCDNV